MSFQLLPKCDTPVNGCLTKIRCYARSPMLRPLRTRACPRWSSEPTWTYSRLIVHVVLEGVHFSDWRCVYQALTTTRLPLAGLRRGSFENECVVGRGILGVE